MKPHDIAHSLHPYERTVLPLLKNRMQFKDIVSKSGLKDIEVMRGLQWLENKKLVQVETTLAKNVKLGGNGKMYIRSGLPERIFLKTLKGPMKLDEIRKGTGLSSEELNICIGILKRESAISLSKDTRLTVIPTQSAENCRQKILRKGNFLDSLKEGRAPEGFTEEEKSFFNEFLGRKDIIKVSPVKVRVAAITELGKDVLRSGLGREGLSRLTPKILREGSWKGKEFRSYDVSINVPRISGGRRHFVKEASEYAKRIWLDLGFREMTGPLLQTSFWNFDALFTAQDHPVREMQDTFYIKTPSAGKLPDGKLVQRVSEAHENGWTTGSTGWQYKWKREEAARNVMRTHTTVLSARTIAALKESELPAKFFALGPCFRNETIDWSHHIEFSQTEGIVVDRNVSFRHLLGYLKLFFAKMGYPQARFRPAYFPYTEMSVEIEVFHPVHKEWTELGGAGIFRPEVVKPLLNLDIPVLAWGPGFDRTIMDYFGINDIRELYSNDLKMLREIKPWLRL